jgi:hypothetical protein
MLTKQELLSTMENLELRNLCVFVINFLYDLQDDTTKALKCDEIKENDAKIVLDRISVLREHCDDINNKCDRNTLTSQEASKQKLFILENMSEVFDVAIDSGTPMYDKEHYAGYRFGVDKQSIVTDDVPFDKDDLLTDPRLPIFFNALLGHYHIKKQPSQVLPFKADRMELRDICSFSTNFLSSLQREIAKIEESDDKEDLKLIIKTAQSQNTYNNKKYNKGQFTKQQEVSAKREVLRCMQDIADSLQDLGIEKNSIVLTALIQESSLGKTSSKLQVESAEELAVSPATEKGAGKA